MEQFFAAESSTPAQYRLAPGVAAEVWRLSNVSSLRPTLSFPFARQCFVAGLAYLLFMRESKQPNIESTKIIYNIHYLDIYG
jgi:hypothetical protein